MAMADLNGDHIFDLSITHGFAGGISIFLGNGDGTFAPEQRFGAVGSAVTVGDLDADGTPDLATAGGFLGDGSALLHR
jgi:hypothetical protein